MQVHVRVDPLAIRRRLGRHAWRAPVQLAAEQWGFAHQRGDGSVIVSVGPIDDVDGGLWRHASMTREGRVSSYEDLCLLHRAVFADGWAYQVFAPQQAHVNFGQFGTI